MQHDDRFSMVAGGAAFLATAAVFALSHLGGPVSLDRTSGSDPSGERITVVEAPRLEPEAVAVPAPFAELVAPEPEIGAAENRPASASGDDGSQLSVAGIPGQPEAGELLRLLSLSGPDVPGTADVLVRRDGDGRMVVASGTHRGYAALVDLLETAVRIRGVDDPAPRSSAAENVGALIRQLETVTELNDPNGVYAWFPCEDVF